MKEGKQMFETQTMTVEITTISTFNQGHFLAEYEGQTYAFQLLDMREWDKLYDHLTKPMKIEAYRSSPAYFTVVKIY